MGAKTIRIMTLSLSNSSIMTNDAEYGCAECHNHVHYAGFRYSECRCADCQRDYHFS